MHRGGARLFFGRKVTCIVVGSMRNWRHSLQGVKSAFRLLFTKLPEEFFFNQVFSLSHLVCILLLLDGFQCVSLLQLAFIWPLNGHWVLLDYWFFYLNCLWFCILCCNWIETTNRFLLLSGRYLWFLLNRCSSDTLILLNRVRRGVPVNHLNLSTVLGVFNWWLLNTVSCWGSPH